MPQHCVGTARQYLKRLRVPGKLVGIYEAEAYFVECVSRQMIIHIEFACQINGPGVGVNQAVYFLPGSLGACHRVCPGQSGEVLPEAVAGNESMKVLFGIIPGHSFGQYLSALARAYAVTRSKAT